ncbi:MAG: lamin tail domain-containing protein, partial [Verrucomicrobiales bacterium]
PYAGGLKNGGEKLTLLDSHSQPIVRFRYDDNEPWPSSADGLGFSLTLKDPRSKQNPDKASAWRASSEVHGSPGRGEPEQDFAGVVINEVLTNTDWPQTDAIELHNPSTKPVDVGGWYLTDDLKEPEKWRIPDGTVIPAEGYWLALEDNDADPDNNAELSKEFFGKAFSLSSLGEVVYLFSADRE